MVEQVIIESAGGFDATSDNYEEFDHELDPARFGKKLSNSNVLKGSYNELQLYDTTHLFIRSREKKHAPEKSYRVNLAWCSSEPEHFRLVIWKWLYISIIFLVLLALDAVLGINEVMPTMMAVYAGIPLLTLSLIFLLVFFYCQRDEYIFKSHYGDTPLFMIENRKPNQGQFDQFFIELQQDIDRLQSRAPVRQKLVGELQMCRRLKDEGIIPEQAYTSVRSKIFKHEEYSG